MPIDPIVIYRCHVAANYETLSDRLSNAIKIKYWWNGTHPVDIDDELGSVIDGQFFGPAPLQKVVYKVIDVLEYLANRKRAKWAKRWLLTGKEPPMFWLASVDPPHGPNMIMWERAYDSADDDFFM
jgi:hypothetical protein